MLMAAAAAGCIDLKLAALEIMLSFRRAGELKFKPLNRTCLNFLGTTPRRQAQNKDTRLYSSVNRRHANV